MKWYDLTMLIAAVAGAMFAGLALLGVPELHPFFEVFRTPVPLWVTLLLGAVVFWTSAQFVVRFAPLTRHVAPPTTIVQHQTPLMVDLDQVRKVTELKAKILGADFLPDVIIGIARGGLLVAAMLSKEFEEQLRRAIPVISLYPDRQNAQVPEFDNDLNHIEINPKSLNLRNNPAKVLIVDDAYDRGTTLTRAKKYVEKSIGTERFSIETAVLSVGDRSIGQPNHFVDRSGKRIWGDREPG
jgi:hypoxanthine phosphoribosyltransferase